MAVDKIGAVKDALLEVPHPPRMFAMVAQIFSGPKSACEVKFELQSPCAPRCSWRWFCVLSASPQRREDEIRGDAQ